MFPAIFFVLPIVMQSELDERQSMHLDVHLESNVDVSNISFLSSKFDENLLNITYFELEENNSLDNTNDVLGDIRNSNISSEIYPGEGKLKKQMEYANKIGSPAVILYGDDEIKSGKATLKNLRTGDETSIKTDELADEIKKLL